MRKGKIIGILTLSLFLTPVYSNGQNAKKFYKAGTVFVEKNAYADAIVQFSKSVELDPDYTKAYLARAKAFELTGNDVQAAEDYKRAIVFLPKNSDVHYQAGRMLNRVGNYVEALNMLNRATGLSRKNLLAYQEKVTTLLALEDFERAYQVADSAIQLKKNPLNYYNRGLVAEKMENYPQAHKDFSSAISTNPNYIDAYLSRARIEVQQNRLDVAMNDCSKALARDDRNIEAYMIRSKIYVKRLEYPNAINDVSRIILIDPVNADMYILRGTYYQDFNQHPNAINDFSKAIDLSPGNPEMYFLRAKSYEEILDYKKAKRDYETIGSLSKYDGEALRLKDEAEQRLFEINRESVKPAISIIEPEVLSGYTLNLPLGKDEVLIKGQIKEESNIKSLLINGSEVHYEKKDEHYEFLASVDISSATEIVILVSDIYENESNKIFTIKRTEILGPEIMIVAPYSSDNGEVYLDNNEDNVYVEGKIEDESLLKSIMIEGVTASYRPDMENPTFSATINIMNKNQFTVIAEDVFGNVSSRTFILNRAGIATQENPMGKTWVVFIQNSKYETFASLEGPVKDVSLMKGALANYQINNVITKQDMTKEELEKFFSIELRDLVRSNQVNSIMIWYAGHGKFINDVGYWIPIDAKRDDEFTYFNISTLKGSLQTYSKYVTHTLVVTDACESGPTFYQAMRSVSEERSCDDWKATRFKSSQVFSSAGYELATDNSQFTRTFANALSNNPNACIPIESIVSQVTLAVAKNNQQRPQFGKIAGMEDENGTFFFIAK